MMIPCNLLAIGLTDKLPERLAHCFASNEGKMKQTFGTKTLKLLMLAAALTLVFSTPVGARAGQEPVPESAERLNRYDPIRQLNLSPEQRQRIRTITEENREERQKINRQLRAAQFALEETLDTDSPSEQVVEQRIRAVADAHAAQIRMRISQELKIRSVLTPDQVSIWRQMRDRNQNLRRRLNNARESRRDSPDGLNELEPLSPRDRRRLRP